MPAWPGTLPTEPLLDGFDPEPGETAVHTSPDEGPHKSRRRFTAPVDTLNWPMLLTLTQYQTLRTFFYNDCAGGSIPVTGLTNPITGLAMTFKIIEPPKPVPDNQYIRCSLKMLVMP